MVVFYSKDFDGGRTYSFIRYLGNVIQPDYDVAYWIIPGTADQMDEWGD
jgi:hypothetical protein